MCFAFRSRFWHHRAPWPFRVSNSFPSRSRPR
jgi:hypothetical protein